MPVELPAVYAFLTSCTFIVKVMRYFIKKLLILEKLLLAEIFRPLIIQVVKHKTQFRAVAAMR